MVVPCNCRLTSVTVDEDFLLPGHVGVVVLVPDGHGQGAGHRLGWTSAVAHDDRDEELFLALAVERPQSRQRGGAVEVVLKVEIVAVAILGGHGKVERGAVLGRVVVHGSEEGRGLVQPDYLKQEEDERLQTMMDYCFIFLSKITAHH